jgi:hypothetical protein
MVAAGGTTDAARLGFTNGYCRLKQLEQDFRRRFYGAGFRFVGEPNREPTMLDPERFQATSSPHSRCSAAYIATLSDLRQRPDRDWGSRGRGFKSRRPDLVDQRKRGYHVDCDLVGCLIGCPLYTGHHDHQVAKHQVRALGCPLLGGLAVSCQPARETCSWLSQSLMSPVTTSARAQARFSPVP